jgi:hypothetical protein
MNKDYVSIKLQGGLANYMFQISAAYSYAKDNDKQLMLDLNNAVIIHKPFEYYKSNIFHKIFEFSSNNKYHFSVLNENGFSFSELQPVEGNVLLNGYFQSDKYFDKYKEEIKNLFSYPSEIIQQIQDKYKDIFKKETCSIHVRRGDYLKFPNHHPTQETSYYMKGVKKIGMDKIFLVFSDDIQWCKDNFPEMKNFVYIEGQKDYEDFLLMSSCKHNIICNSSFSWWAAWINQNSNKIVIAPKKWFGPAYAHFDTKDLYCEDWILL